MVDYTNPELHKRMDNVLMAVSGLEPMTALAALNMAAANVGLFLIGMTEGDAKENAQELADYQKKIFIDVLSQMIDIHAATVKKNG